MGTFETQEQIKTVGLHPGDGSHHILNLKCPLQAHFEHLFPSWLAIFWKAIKPLRGDIQLEEVG